MLTLSVADLRFRYRQFAIAVLGSASVFAMALVMQGLAAGFSAEAQRTVAATRADYFLVANSGGGPFTSVRAFPQTVRNELVAAQGVEQTGPLVVLPNVAVHSGHPVNIHLIGYQPGALGQPPLTGGRLAEGPGEAVVDTLSNIAVGERFLLGGREFHAVGRVAGLSYQAGIANVYVTLGDAQQLAFNGRPDITLVALVGRPAVVPSGFTVYSASEARADMLRPLSNALTAVSNARLFLWAVAAVIIGVVVYLSALERQRDFAVLKAIGFSAGRLFVGLAIQSTVVALAAVGVSAVGYRLLAPLIPIPLSLSTAAFAVLPAVAVGVGILASLSGIRQTVRVDPALAFAGR